MCVLRLQEAEQKESDEVESLEREGVSLRWAGHRLHGASIGLRQRHDATMGTLEGRSDGEARAVMLRLVRDFREMNGELAAHLSRTSMLNLGVVEMLRKSRDGRAALMMRSAAEILVKVRLDVSDCNPMYIPFPNHVDRLLFLCIYGVGISDVCVFCVVVYSGIRGTKGYNGTYHHTTPIFEYDRFYCLISRVLPCFCYKDQVFVLAVGSFWIGQEYHVLSMIMHVCWRCAFLSPT